MDIKKGLGKKKEKINNGIVYYYDFVDSKNKKIIEFNGDCFHANPLLFDKFDKPHPFNKELLAEDIWRFDNEKISFIKNLGYDVLIVWESDYYKNKEETINKCIEFLKR